MSNPVRKNLALPVKDKSLQSGHSNGANRFSIVKLGCPKNLVDSDNLIQKLISNGFSYLHSHEDADILLINTCGFIEDAKKESIEEILKLAETKKSREKMQDARFRTQDKKNRASCIVNHESKGDDKKLIVFGCLAKRYKNELIKEIPEIDALFGVGEDEKIVEYCKRIKGSEGQQNRIQDTGYKIHDKKNRVSCIMHHESFSLTPPSYAYLKIAEGCNKRCSYCVIPSIRGNYRSIPPDDILKEAERLINAGVKELILVAQDTACYGKDLNSSGADDITSLLKDLCSINGNFWVRLLYAYPASIKNSLINVIAEEKKICKYLDIPFQHSEDRILKLMKRGGSRKGYLNLIKNIRHAVPDIVLRTTFIVGFPSETEKEFNSLIDFIEEVGFDRLGVFKYSREEGTPASKLKGQLTEAEKNRRLDKIMRHQSHISLEKNKKLIGKQFKAIIDEIDNEIVIGRLYSHAPEIDGVVIIQNTKHSPPTPPSPSREEGKGGGESPGTVTWTLDSLKVGDFVNVEITDAFDYDLKGIVVK